MDEVRWEEPPYRRTRSGSGRHTAIAAQLKAKPGQWAHIDTFDTAALAASMAYAVSRGRNMSAYRPAGAFEAKARTVNGERRLYARYVGGSHDG